MIIKMNLPQCSISEKVISHLLPFMVGAKAYSTNMISWKVITVTNSIPLQGTNVCQLRFKKNKTKKTHHGLGWN